MNCCLVKKKSMDDEELPLFFIWLFKQISYLLFLWHLDVQGLLLFQEYHLVLANQEILGDLLGLWGQVVQEHQGNHAGTGNNHNFEFFHSEVRLAAGLKNKTSHSLCLKANLKLMFQKLSCNQIYDYWIGTQILSNHICRSLKNVEILLPCTKFIIVMV